MTIETSPAMTEQGDSRQFGLLQCPHNQNTREDIIMNAKIKSRLVTSIALASLFAGLAGVASAAEPYGVWVRPSTGTQVNFYDCGGKLCGKIVAVKDQARKSEVGTVIMPGATKSGDNKWEGDLLEADTGKTYSGVVTLQGPSALNLKGCILMICKGETWTKVK
jgi:uncharacterized protein (DUF2147 family)